MISNISSQPERLLKLPLCLGSGQLALDECQSLRTILSSVAIVGLGVVAIAAVWV